MVSNNTEVILLNIEPIERNLGLLGQKNHK